MMQDTLWAAAAGKHPVVPFCRSPVSGGSTCETERTLLEAIPAHSVA
jgi:hypothetical protein